MKIKKISIHNFRSIKEGTFNLENFSLLIGENNSGKSNLISALRTFYENDGAKYKESIDFLKFNTDDNESWIEIEYLTTDNEQSTLKEAYKSKDKILKVRRYFKATNPDIVKSNQSNIYAYVDGILSFENLFYGAQNISQAKLGKVIFIPEISKTEDNLKLSGPSPFRDMVTFVMKKSVKNSPAYNELESAFENFNKNFKEEYSKDGFSLTELVKDINEQISQWEIKFGLNFNPIKPEDMIKNLLSHYFEDNNLKNEQISINLFGQGLQRHLIYTLIKLSAKYVDKKVEKKKDFSPDFTLILFEEPEAFLHPSQQEQLNLSLKVIAQEEDQQVICSTHSPIFVSKNIRDLLSLIRLNKVNGQTKLYLLSKNEIDSLFDENVGLFKKINEIYNDPKTNPQLKAKIKEKFINVNDDINIKLEEESIRYFLWFDSERAALFFAKHIIICEGASEKIFLDFLVSTKWNELKTRGVYLLDSLGKFNFHRYMNLFNKFGITHSLLMDSDNNKDIQDIVNDFILNNKNGFTKEVYSFPTDLEDFLGIQKPVKCRNDRKPLNILSNFHNNKIPETKISELKKVFEKLL